MFTGIKTDYNNVHNTTFASWGAFTDTVENMRWDPLGSETWAGGSKKDAFTLARKGWPEQSKCVAKLAARVADRIVEHSALGIANHIVADVCGAAYDPGAYMSGVPECWLAFQPVEEKNSVRIIADGTISAGAEKRWKIKSGTAIAALVIALASKGHPVTLDLYFGGTKGKAPTDCYVRLHDGLVGGPLDIDRMTYALAHTLPMRGMAHTLWGRGVMPHSGSERPEQTHGAYDLWIGGGHLSDVRRWNDDGESWVLEQYTKQSS